MYVFCNLPGFEHKSKSSIWGRLTLCGVFNTLFLQGHRSLCASSKHTQVVTHIWAYIHAHSFTHTLAAAGWGAGQAEWNYQARPWALSSNFQRKQILDATVIFPFNTEQESSWHICSLPMSPICEWFMRPALSFLHHKQWRWHDVVPPK